MVRISAVSGDWIEKGCHLHVGKIKIKLRPDHRGCIVFRKVFSGTSDQAVDAASKEMRELLEDPEWRRRLASRLKGALGYLLGVEGSLRVTARSRSGEIQRLLHALKRLEET